MAVLGVSATSEITASSKDKNGFFLTSIFRNPTTGQCGDWIYFSESTKTIPCAFLGRLEISKGTELLLEASQLCLAQGHSDILITFYGEGGNSASLRRFVEQRGLSDIVRLDGWKSSKHLLEALGKCHVVLMPTTSEFPEALDKSLIEAALMKVAVIATRVVPATGLLGSSCLVIPEDDARNLADAILLLKSDPLLVNRLQVGSNAERSVFLTHSLASVLP